MNMQVSRPSETSQPQLCQESWTPAGRIPKDFTLKQRMARKLRTKPGQAAYARRKAIVEPVFGQIHTLQGKHVLLRGLATPARSGTCCRHATTCANSTATSESPAWESSNRPPEAHRAGQQEHPYARVHGISKQTGATAALSRSQLTTVTKRRMSRVS